MWYRIIQAELHGHSAQVAIEDFPGFSTPARSRYAATTPALLQWFRTYNQSKLYREQVKPFNFLLSYQASPSVIRHDDKCGSHLLEGEVVNDQIKRRRCYKVKQLHPVSPFDTDYTKAVKSCFDRISGESITTDQLQTYIDALRQYHLHPEAKFDCGDYVDQGFTQRKHIIVSSVEHIGKEANRWEQQFYTGIDDAQIVYGIPQEAIKAKWDDVFRACQHFKIRQIAKASELDASEVSRLLSGKRIKPTLETLQKLEKGIKLLQDKQQEYNEQTQNIINQLRQVRQLMSFREFAKLAGVDQGSLIRIFGRKKKASKNEVFKIESAMQSITL